MAVASIRLLPASLDVISSAHALLGFVGLTIPFAFGIGRWRAGHLDTHWLRSVRRWTLVPWLFLTSDLLGGQWALCGIRVGRLLGWDPVENASLMPWLTSTAFCIR